MYLEFGHGTLREGWKYYFTGAELFPKAESLLKSYSQKEGELRAKMSKMMLDNTLNANSDEVSKCRSEIETTAKLKEQCQVWAFGFKRDLEREFTLGMGDVVFFGFLEENDE